MTLRPLIGALALSLLLVACGGQDDHADDGHEGDAHGAEAPARGEHGGRLLAQDGVTVELGIAESGTPPRRTSRTSTVPAVAGSGLLSR